MKGELLWKTEKTDAVTVHIGLTVNVRFWTKLKMIPYVFVTASKNQKRRNKRSDSNVK